VLALHGAGSTGSYFEAYHGFSVLADHAGADLHYYTVDGGTNDLPDIVHAAPDDLYSSPGIHLNDQESARYSSSVPPGFQ
jgi:hypothetical protein